MWLWWSHTQRCYGCHVLLMRELNACVFCFFSLFQFSDSNLIIHSPADGVPITRCRRVSLCIFEIASVCQCSVFVAPRSYCPYAVFKHSRACTQTHTPHNAHLQHNTHTRDTESDHIIYCAHVQISHSCALNRYHHTRHAQIILMLLYLCAENKITFVHRSLLMLARVFAPYNVEVCLSICLLMRGTKKSTLFDI